jgi:hypothetical protein
MTTKDSQTDAAHTVINYFFSVQLLHYTMLLIAIVFLYNNKCNVSLSCAMITWTIYVVSPVCIQS